MTTPLTDIPRRRIGGTATRLGGHVGKALLVVSATPDDPRLKAALDAALEA